jgi:hypothetical protein
MLQEAIGDTFNPTSFRTVLKELISGNRPHLIGENQVSPLETIRELTAAYYLFGAGFAFKDMNIVRLVEHAICPLARDSSNFLVASFSEPYTAWCCYNFFKCVTPLDQVNGQFRENKMPIEDIIFHELGQFHFLPSVRGLVVEGLLVPSIIRHFSRTASIDQDPYFDTDELRQELPQWFRNIKWDVTLEPLSQRPIMRHSCTQNLLDWLQNDGQQVFIPENAAKADTVVPLRFIHGLSFPSWCCSDILV